MTEIKRRAEIRMGELLRETEQSGQRRQRGKSHVAEHRHEPTLAQLGITRDQSSDFQKLAAVPKEEMEARIAAARSDPKAMTTARLLQDALRFSHGGKKI